jgi:hypothetical protein
MSGPLGGDIAELFGSVFGGIYLDAKLYRDTYVEDGRGGWVRSGREVYDIKVQEDHLSEVSRREAGYTALDARLLILTPPVELTTDHRVFFDGAVYTVNPDVERDPAKSHIATKATRTNESPPDLDEGS